MNVDLNIIAIFDTEEELNTNFPIAKKYSTKDILEYFPDFLENNKDIKIRKIVLDEIDKVNNCRTPKLGGSVWECTECGYSTFHFFTCKSRFCSTCGSKYSNQRVNNAMSIMYHTNHRHITFTIAKELRKFFRMDRNMLNLLFEAVDYTLSSWIKEQNKKEDFKLGFIQVLHTFGRAINWNPHIHVLVAEVAMGNTKIERKVDFFPYNMLRKRFQAKLLDLMKKYIKKHHNCAYKQFKKLVAKLFKDKNNGFYVRAPKQQFKSIKGGLQYILRYCGRPVFASPRIISIDDNYITFWYQRHDDDKFVVEKIHIYHFIKRIIMHIQEKGFKTIRYYGFYSKHHKQEKNYTRILNKEQYLMQKQFTTWRMLSLSAFKEDPYECKKCKGIMNLCFYFRPGEVFF